MTGSFFFVASFCVVLVKILNEYIAIPGLHMQLLTIALEPTIVINV